MTCETGREGGRKTVYQQGGGEASYPKGPVCVLIPKLGDYPGEEGKHMREEKINRGKKKR